MKYLFYLNIKYHIIKINLNSIINLYLDLFILKTKLCKFSKYLKQK